jgi:hypothetical protein
MLYTHDNGIVIERDDSGWVKEGTRILPAARSPTDGDSGTD